MQVVGGTPTLTGVTFQDNVAYAVGGGISSEPRTGSVLVLDSCVLQANDAVVEGGGMMIAQSTAAQTQLINTIICENLPQNVAGLYTADSASEICDCLPDLYADGIVNAADLSILLSQWGGGANSTADLNRDGIVGAQDISLLLDGWGVCP